jgi:hypothetical protein
MILRLALALSVVALGLVGPTAMPRAHATCPEPPCGDPAQRVSPQMPSGTVTPATPGSRIVPLSATCPEPPCGDPDVAPSHQPEVQSTCPEPPCDPRQGK